MDFCHFFSSSKDFTFDFSMSHCYTRYRSEEISPPPSLNTYRRSIHFGCMLDLLQMGQIFNFQYTVYMCCNNLWKYLEGFQQNLETFLRTKFCQRRSLDLTQFFLRSFLQMIFLFTMSGNHWCQWSSSIRLHCSAIMCSL